jgi:predicted ribosomally synthesized peptide with nif11-like leader
MSIESARAFYERVETDVQLQEKLKELNTKDNIEPYVKGELGYEFTLEEMQKVVFEKNPEMTEEELEAVVGGGVIGGALLILLAGPVFIVGLAVGVAAA